MKNNSFKGTTRRRFAYTQLTMEIAHHEPELHLYEDVSVYPWLSNPTQQAMLDGVVASDDGHTASHAKISAPCTETAQANGMPAADSKLYSRSKVHICPGRSLCLHRLAFSLPKALSTFFILCLTLAGLCTIDKPSDNVDLHDSLALISEAC